MSSTKSTPIKSESATDDSPQQGRAAGLKRCIDEITTEEAEIEKLQASMDKSKKRLKVAKGKMEVLLYGKESVSRGNNTEGDVIESESTASREFNIPRETLKKARYSIYQQDGFLTPPSRSAKRLVGDKGFTHDVRVANAAAQALAQDVRGGYDKQRKNITGSSKAEEFKSNDSNMLQITVTAIGASWHRAEMSTIWVVRESA